MTLSMTESSFASLTFDILLHDVVDDRVDVFVDILEETWKSVFDRHLELLQEVGIVEGHHL